MSSQFGGRGTPPGWFLSAFGRFTFSPHPTNALWPAGNGRVMDPPLRRKNGPGALVRQSQAQLWNRIGGKFPPTQGPSGPGWKHWQALLALRAGNFAELFRSGPRKWGPGKGDYEHEVLIGAVPGGVLVTLPPRAK